MQDLRKTLASTFIAAALLGGSAATPAFAGDDKNGDDKYYCDYHDEYYDWYKYNKYHDDHDDDHGKDDHNHNHDHDHDGKWKNDRDDDHGKRWNDRDGKDDRNDYRDGKKRNGHD